MTLPQVYQLVDYWRAHPPTHELMAMMVGFQPPQTTEDKWRDGAMNPAEALEWFRRTGGKMEGVAQR